MVKTRKALGALALLIFSGWIDFYLTANVHTLLTVGKAYPLPVSLHGNIALIGFVWNNSKMRNIFSIFLLLIICGIVYVFIVQSIYDMSVGGQKIIPGIVTPLVSGQGEYGTARWLKKSEFSKSFDVARMPTMRQLNRLQRKNAEEVAKKVETNK